MNQVLANPGQNYLAGLTGGLQAGGAFQQMQAQREDREKQKTVEAFFAENGAALAQGNPDAVNAFAALDPMGAYDIRRQARSDAQATERHNASTALSAAQLDQIRAKSKRDVETHAANMSAVEREAEARKIAAALAASTAAYKQGPEAFNLFVQNNAQAIADSGFDPSQTTYETFPQIAAGIAGAQEGLTATLGFVDDLMPDKPKPLTDEAKANVDAKNGFIDLNLPKVDFDTEQKLRKEFLGIPAVKAFSEQAQAFDRIVNSAKDPSPAGDLALIFNFMKVLDPGSVVRESEFETAAQATAWLQQSEEMGANVPQPIASAIRKMASGQRLAPAQREDFVSRGQALYDGAERGFLNIKTQYEDKASAYNLDPNRSLMDFRRSTQEAAPDEATASPSITFQNDEQRSVFEKYSQ